MVQFWYKLVASGKKTIDEVPLKWKDAVSALLDGDES